MKDYPFERVLEVMKPNHFKLESTEHQRKFKLMMTDESNYVAEEKIDGCHYMVIEERFFSTRVSAVTCSPVEKTNNLPHLVKYLQDLKMPNLILDGEICYPGLKSQDVITVTGSLPDVAIAKQQENGFLHYRVFDMLRVPGGKWITNEPWHVRRKLMEELFKAIPPVDYIQLNSVIHYDKQQFLDNLLQRGCEGIVLKDVLGIYELGKRPMWNWMKVKVEGTDDAVIMGFEPPTKEYTGKEMDSWPYWVEENEHSIPVTKFYHMDWIGAMVLGKYNEEGELVRIGTCSGFDEGIRQQFSEKPEEFIGRVARIKVMEKTHDGAYRHPSFIDFHPDKNAKECKL